MVWQMKLGVKLENVLRYLSAKDKGRDIIYIKWTVAHKSGSGGYDDPCNCSLNSGDEQPEFHALNEILTDLWPNISYFEFLELYKTLCKKEEDNDCGYYGEDSLIKYHYIFVDELLEYVKKATKKRKK